MKVAWSCVALTLAMPFMRFYWRKKNYNTQPAFQLDTSAVNVFAQVSVSHTSADKWILHTADISLWNQDEPSETTVKSQNATYKAR